jgi:hypothetical protein
MLQAFKQAAKAVWKESTSVLTEAKSAMKELELAIEAGTATDSEIAAVQVILKTAHREFVLSIHGVALCVSKGKPFIWCK